MNSLDVMNNLIKALEAGNYNAAPSTLAQGAALQIEDLSPVMYNTTYESKHLKLQKMLKVTDCKSTTAQFDRQLSYGIFGGSAQLEGNVGQEETSEFVRIVVPMAFYSSTRRVTIASTMVATVDGQKSDERAASDAAIKLSGDVEFDLFRGKTDFSNAGVFDGNPFTMSALPNMQGLDQQIRMSDGQRNAQDLMFGEFGSDDSVVIAGGSVLIQDNIEDAATRSAMNHGSADKLIVDPIVLSNYNKIVYNKERIVLAGSAQDATGATLRRQWVSGGTVELEASRFLSGKTRPTMPRSNGPAAPASVTAATSTVSGVTTPFTIGQVYRYYVTSGNEVGESSYTAPSAFTVTVAGDACVLTITHPGSGVTQFFNVYRSAAGGSLASAKFIGRVKFASGASTTAFTDLGNKQPGFVTGFLVDADTMEMRQLAPYSRLKMAVSDLSQPEAHFRFVTLAVMEPRKNVLIDNLR